MKYIWTLVLLSAVAYGQVIPGGGATPTSSIVGQLQTATGGIIKAGTLTFTLSQPAIAAGIASVVTQATSCYTANQGNVVGLPDPQALPIASANLSAGSMTAGTYYVQVFYVNAANAVSAPSPEIAVTLSGTGEIIVTAPSFQPSVATGYGVAISTTSGAESIQGIVTGWTQFIQTVAPTTGNPPPTTNNSVCNVWFSDALIPTGTYYTVNLQNRNGSQVAGYPQTWCTYGGATGTIDVSQGAPTGNCNTKGVFYPTPIFSNPPGLAQSITGKVNLTGALASTGTINLTNPGVFTNDQMHQYVTSLIGGIPSDFYHSVQGFPGYTTEAGTFGVSVPAAAPIGESDALVGMVTTACNSSSRTTCNAVALSGHAEVTANGGAAWGQNTTVSNHNSGITGVNLVGNEIDVGITGNQSAGYVHGLDIFLSNAIGATMPTNVSGTGLEIGATSGQWSQGIYIMGTSIQNTGNAIYVDPACVTGPCSSAKVTLTGLDGGNVPHFGSLSVNQNGGIILTSTAGQPSVVTSDGLAIPGSSSGTITLKDQSSAASGTMLIPNPAGSGVLTQLIGSGTATTAGTAIGSGAAQSVTITVTGATTADVATCSTNASYGANWAFISVLPPIVTANTVTLTIVNPSAGSVTPAAQTFNCAVRR